MFGTIIVVCIGAVHWSVTHRDDPWSLGSVLRFVSFLKVKTVKSRQTAFIQPYDIFSAYQSATDLVQISVWQCYNMATTIKNKFTSCVHPVFLYQRLHSS